jgi:hypothetical protein
MVSKHVSLGATIALGVVVTAFVFGFIVIQVINHRLTRIQLQLPRITVNAGALEEAAVEQDGPVGIVERESEQEQYGGGSLPLLSPYSLSSESIQSSPLELTLRRKLLDTEG